MTSFRRLAFGTAWATAALIVFGGVVRITQSGMGCGDDWPLCNGELVPTFTFPVAIEFGHRVFAAAIILLVVALVAIAWTKHRHRSELLRPAVLALVLILIQALLGAITVWLELPPTAVILHFGNSLMTMTAVMIVGFRARPDGARAALVDRFAKWTMATASLGLLVILMGAWVANIEAGPACRGFPLCNGELLPGPGVRIHIHWTHRMLAYLFLAAVVGQMVAFRRHRRGDRRVRRAQLGVVVATGGQVLIAAVMILHFLPPAWRVLHVGFGTLTWMALVATAYWARHPLESSEAG